ncbi:MAG: hypothetical protein WAX04_00935 [Oscillospiraceae bacterium]
MPSEKDTELEAILTEINSGIKKEKSSNNSTSSKKLKKLEDTVKIADTYEDAPKPSFIQTARIIEEVPEPIDIDRKSKHIQVTAGEKISLEQEKDSDEENSSKETSKGFSKSDLKRANGTAVSRQHERKKAPSKKQKKIALFGVIIAFLVVVGAVSTIWSAIKLTNNIVNETSLKEELARAIFPLVIVDIPEFETAVKLDNSAIIASSIWEFIIHEEDKSKFKKDDLGSIYVPDVDIEKYIRRLYGSEVKILHQSVDDSSVQMTYNAESKYYVIESTPKFLPYTPRVDKIIKTSDILTLRVSYILPDAMWNLRSDKKDETVDKVMEYKLKKSGNAYQMLSVKLIEVTTRIENSAEKNIDESLQQEQAQADEVSSEIPVTPTTPVEASPKTK